MISSAVGGDDPASHELPEDADAQIRNAFQNVRAILERAGGSTDNIGKVTVHLRDQQIRSLLNPHWIAMFPDENDRPVRHTLTGDLSPGRHIQLEFIAVI